MMAPLDRSRLAAVLGLLGSDHPGEVVNAAQAAERMRRQAGLSWHDIVQSPPPVVQPTKETEIEDDLDFLLDNLDELSGWDLTFARSVANRSAFSEMQIVIIRRMPLGCAAWRRRQHDRPDPLHRIGEVPIRVRDPAAGQRPDFHGRRCAAAGRGGRRARI